MNLRQKFAFFSLYIQSQSGSELNTSHYTITLSAIADGTVHSLSHICAKHIRYYCYFFSENKITKMLLQLLCGLRKQTYLFISHIIAFQKSAGIFHIFTIVSIDFDIRARAIDMVVDAITHRITPPSRHHNNDSRKWVERLFLNRTRKKTYTAFHFSWCGLSQCFCVFCCCLVSLFWKARFVSTYFYRKSSQSVFFWGIIRGRQICEKGACSVYGLHIFRSTPHSAI